MGYIKQNIKILLTGGGTGGSVSPLLAVAEELRGRGKYKFLWIGTKKGIERKIVEDANIQFKTITGGKLRRYFSWRNFIDPFLTVIGFFQALFILLVWRPNLVISAGSFVSVPVVWAAWILRIPILAHQQDARPGLANKLMAPCAKVITVSFESSLKDYGEKAVWTGNPIRSKVKSQKSKVGIEDAKRKFGLKENMPTVLIIGGGTGAMAINKLVAQNLSELTKFCQIIHITGKNKRGSTSPEYSGEVEPLYYQPFEFLDIKQMAAVYAVADVVVSRCGMGVLTELSYLCKPAILIPMPNSHQEDNAKIFKENKAAIILDQNKLTPTDLAESIKGLTKDEERQKMLSENIKIVMKPGANGKIVEIINSLF